MSAESSSCTSCWTASARQLRESSLGVLRRGGKAIGISGPPDPAFAHEIDASLMLRLAMTALSRGIRRKARRLGVSYDFLFMRASGDQIAKIAALVDAAAIRPVIGRIVPFDQTPEALGSPEQGRGPRQGRHQLPLTGPAWQNTSHELPTRDQKGQS
jgi:NADPH:quinone reductase-like Zn-dependent oxidoreductase